MSEDEIKSPKITAPVFAKNSPKRSAISFENADIDYKPLEKTGFAKVQESIFRLVSGNKAKSVIAPKRPPTPVPAKSDLPYMGPPFHPDNRPTAFNPQNNLNEPVVVPKGFAVENGLLVRAKSLPERVKMQLKHGYAMRASAITVRGLALAAFAIGAVLIYSEIPAHPDIVIGIVLCSVAGNVLVGNRE